MSNESAVLEKVKFDFPLAICKQTDEEGEFHVVGYAATSDFDLQGDIITEEALRASQLDLLKNSTVLLNHDVKLPIGKVVKAEFDQKGLLIDVLISKTEPDVIQKIKEGVLNKFSIRGQVLEREKKFMPELDRVVNVIQRMSLLEVSIVSLPANPEARAIGWYLKKALDEAENIGGVPMPKKNDPTSESIPDDKGKATVTEPESKPPAPEKEPELPPIESPAPEASGEEIEKQSSASPHLSLTWPLLDRLITMGGEAGTLGIQIKTLLSLQLPVDKIPAIPNAPVPALSKAETSQLIADEVKKQLDSVLKEIPVIRKGLVQSDDEPSDIKKKFEELAPEQKLKVALALSGSVNGRSTH